MLPRNDSLQLLFCIQNKCVCVGEHKEDYAKVGERKVESDAKITTLVWDNCPHQSGPRGFACISLNDTSRAQNISGISQGTA